MADKENESYNVYQMQPQRHYRLLNPANKAQILEMARLGMSMSDCARALRIDPSTANKWMKRGQEDLENDEPSIYADLYVDYIQAEAVFIQRAITMWQTHWKDDWRSIEALLKRRFPKSWGDAAKELEDGGSVSEAVKVLLMSEELDAI